MGICCAAASGETGTAGTGGVTKLQNKIHYIFSSLITWMIYLGRIVGEPATVGWGIGLGMATVGLRILEITKT